MQGYLTDLFDFWADSVECRDFFKNEKTSIHDYFTDQGLKCMVANGFLNEDYTLTDKAVKYCETLEYEKRRIY